MVIIAIGGIYLLDMLAGEKSIVEMRKTCNSVRGVFSLAKWRSYTPQPQLQKWVRFFVEMLFYEKALKAEQKP